MTIAIFFGSWLAFSTLMSIWSVSINLPLLIILWIPLGYAAAFIAFLVFITIMVLIFNINPAKSTKFRIHFFRSAIWIINRMILNVSVKAVGVENIPLNEVAMCYGNHRSVFDVFLVAQFINRKITVSPKDTLFKNGYIRLWLKYLRAMKVTRDNDRETAREMIKAIKRIKEGDFMIMFPEGTSKNHESDLMSGSRVGAYKIALKAGAAIVPVSLFGSVDIKKNAPWRRTKATVKFHEAIPYDTFKDMSTKEIDEMVEVIINKGISECQELTQKRKKQK